MGQGKDSLLFALTIAAVAFCARGTDFPTAYPTKSPTAFPTHYPTRTPPPTSFGDSYRSQRDLNLAATLLYFLVRRARMHCAPN